MNGRVYIVFVAGLMFLLLFLGFLGWYSYSRISKERQEAIMARMEAEEVHRAMVEAERAAEESAVNRQGDFRQGEVPQEKIQPEQDQVSMILEQIEMLMENSSWAEDKECLEFYGEVKALLEEFNTGD